jgi:phosphodiesterase/alkaline phosphatase D-like protein
MSFFPESVSGEYLGDGRARISTVVEGSGDVRVEWEVSRHRNFRTWVSHGTVIATQADGYRVSVEVDELPADSRLYYRFKCNGEYSAQAQVRT